MLSCAAAVDPRLTLAIDNPLEETQACFVEEGWFQPSHRLLQFLRGQNVEQGLVQATQELIQLPLRESPPVPPRPYSRKKPVEHKGNEHLGEDLEALLLSKIAGLDEYIAELRAKVEGLQKRVVSQENRAELQHALAKAKKELDFASRQAVSFVCIGLCSSPADSLVFVFSGSRKTSQLCSIGINTWCSV